MKRIETRTETCCSTVKSLEGNRTDLGRPQEVNLSNCAFFLKRHQEQDAKFGNLSDGKKNKKQKKKTKMK